MAQAAQAQGAPEIQVPLAFTQALPAAQDYPVSVAQRAADYCAAAERAVIDSPEKMEQGATLDKMCQTLLKKAEDERTKLTGPLNQVVKLLNGKFKAVTEPVETARKTIQRKMIAYKTEQDRIAREKAAAEQKAREEAALAEASELAAQGATEEAEQVLADAVDAPAPLAAIPTGPVRSDLGAVSSFVTDWKYEVTDAALVPREYLCVDDKKVKEAIKGDGGIRTIPGLRIFSEQRVVTR